LSSSPSTIKKKGGGYDNDHYQIKVFKNESKISAGRLNVFFQEPL
jgi:hypothetical protein